jgi:phosphoserine phosphatase RsbU/P
MQAEPRNTKILIAEDDEPTLTFLEHALRKWDYEPVLARDGHAAWELLIAEGAPRIALLDWLMPGMTGVEICERARKHPRIRTDYLVLISSRGELTDVIEGLEAGADDLLPKPFDMNELLARIHAGVRVVGLQNALSARVQELEEALARVKYLQGLLPICSYCKKIRNDKNYWQQVDTYISEHSEARFSHGVCPDCLELLLKQESGKLPPPSEGKKQ